MKTLSLFLLKFRLSLQCRHLVTSIYMQIRVRFLALLGSKMLFPLCPAACLKMSPLLLLIKRLHPHPALNGQNVFTQELNTEALAICSKKNYNVELEIDFLDWLYQMLLTFTNSYLML